MSNILPAFNDHFVEFITDIQEVFPENHDIAVAKNTVLAIRKANPRMIIKLWTTFVVGKYKGEIDRGDISFFVDKDYSNDLAEADNSKKIMDAIDRLRSPVKQMNDDDQKKAMKYIQNLTKLSAMYQP
jgi:hypothetical protein